MKLKKYSRITPTKLNKFSNKCATVVKSIVELEIGDICIPSLEYLLTKSIEEWIEECDLEKEMIWNKVYKIPPTPVFKEPKKKKKAGGGAVSQKSAKPVHQKSEKAVQQNSDKAVNTRKKVSKKKSSDCS